jgi:7 transmembrane receptor (rhodopsin family)
MLFVVVLEFFICWTPLYVINTITLFDQRIVYQNLGYTAISFFQLLAYSSSCCNPITYCFMNVGFRKAFLNLFRCLKQSNEPTRRVSLSGYGNNNVPVIATSFHGIGNPEISTVALNNNHLLATSVSDNYDYARQPSFNMHKQEKMTLNEHRRDKQTSNGALQ